VIKGCDESILGLLVDEARSFHESASAGAFANAGTEAAACESTGLQGAKMMEADGFSRSGRLVANPSPTRKMHWGRVAGNL
jgi:hypothetical protein